MQKQAIGDQNLLNALTPRKETLTVTNHVATLTVPIGAVFQVVATKGTTTGPFSVIFAGTVATKQAIVDRDAKTITFYATDAVTECYVEYLEGFE